MKILITGGTGFVGSHTVAELVRAGHQVRLLVRDRSRVRAALEPLGVEATETVIGDVTDEKSVEEAARNCDATIHCGSVYSLDPRAAERINRTNVLGTDLVLGTAFRLGHDPIVHVSSFVALIGSKGAVLTPSCLPGNPQGAYFRSKAESDRVARRYQEKGAPVVITYPGSVWGPHDPHLGESCEIAKNILCRYWSVSPRGTIAITDVRDLARLHLSVVEKGRGPRRYIGPITNVSIKEAINAMAAATGRSLPTATLPSWMLQRPVQLLDRLQFILPFRLPFNYQAVYCAGLQHVVDDSITRQEFGILARPIETTLGDTVGWMVQAEHLPRKLAGRLGG